MAAPCAYAAAWTLEQHTGQIILNTTYYRATDTFTQTGGRRSFSNDGEFTKWEINPYVEYGLRNDLTLVLNLFWRSLRFSDRFGSSENSGMVDPEIGLRYRLSPPEAQPVWSVQGVVKLPVTSSPGTPELGNDQTDVEGRLLVGRGFSVGSSSGFWNIEAAYRFRSEAPADEIRLDATLGYDLSPKWLVMGQIFVIRGLRNGSPIEVKGNPTIDPNFDLYKGQVSLVYRVGPKLRVQAGYLRDLAGRNTGAGQGLLVSLWLNF